MREEDQQEVTEYHAWITRRAFLVLAAAVGGSVVILRKLPKEWFQRRRTQPLVILSGNVADETAAILGRERIRWKGKEVVGLCDCQAYALPKQGLRFKVDNEVPQVPAPDFFPEKGLHVIEWVAVDEEGYELDPPLLSFTALFS